ncbi:glycoside hydrolase family 31 protein [Amycolatopsis carbonis]|uniref:Glycoside hydrolase family 31 protein n=1 Tax=Amycolatopsis carbonis TaxID=715471 RepID=A0A9Y2I9E4_9PSEU|nr:TIM-barrel domain-containing protein [Amycolatopsis sp. 2-15]WIX75106.1 glycoside hydrolase family 31 protein [Amycolatopsis sp. 2-15]
MVARRATSVRRRLLVRLLAVACLAGTLVSTGVSAGAASDSALAAQTVTAGQARFEVLSPTLIRTEYAGDSAFVDAGTFNAVGRGSFARTPYTATKRDGWLTIRTSAVQVRYKLGSGAFSDGNLTVELRAGGQEVTARPWAGKLTPVCAFGTLCEAEDLQLSGPGAANDHRGYTGAGFAAGFANAGDDLAFRTTAAAAGDYQLDLRYANGSGGDGQHTTRTLTVLVDGGDPHTVSLPPTADWDTWALATVPVTLSAGEHQVSVARAATDSGNVNVDSLAVVTTGASYPQPVPPAPAPCAFGALCEAEQGALAGGARSASDHDGYSGKGFLAGMERVDASGAFTVTGVPANGSYDLQLRYADATAVSGQTQPTTLSLQVDGAAPTSLTLPATSSWNSWRTTAVPVKLAAGTNTVRLGCPDSTNCHLNVDTVAITRPHSALLAPHAALGGYRRGLDGVDGTAVTAPGILYQDGWSLLDDTASALYDPRTKVVTQRPAHGGKAYQDGYVFAYGQDYARALRELAQLTGPSLLLPRWSYGVWYSEYYDRTAGDFEQTILPKFRSENVPLDMLVVDTDFKTPNKWNGWEIDPARFPDPAAFFQWAHDQGLHTGLNVHPSILASDPQFAAAQATAKGKLKPGSCGGGGTDCYVFDFGDPDQLRAYFDLHRPMEQQGNDLWWLDWCCDGSNSGLAGVTPDSWINQQYADDAAKTVGRGFAFSRAYGSLQAGGYSSPTAVPTGPWADKRTTLHFTGDTTSDWATLGFEVGYTPGESAATGLASVSHDIGGHTGGLQEPGSEPGSTKLPDDLYARWVQFGTFQPIDRLHSNHSDRLPWQYGAAADASATKFLNLREDLVPYTYTLAQQATATGLPIVRPLYLQYPGQQEAYAQAGGEYLYGPDVLVAPVTSPGTTATTSVWFPPGSDWTDYFTGKTYHGGTTAQITTGWDTMPVFLRSGGIMVTRSGDVTGDEGQPLTAPTVTVAGGHQGAFTLYEDDGQSPSAKGATTGMTYTEDAHSATLAIAPHGSYPGRPAQRTWTVRFTDAKAPSAVFVDGHRSAEKTWTWDPATKTVTVRTPAQPAARPLTVRLLTS